MARASMVVAAGVLALAPCQAAPDETGPPAAGTTTSPVLAPTPAVPDPSQFTNDATDAPAGERIVLVPGDVRVVDLAGVQRVAVGDGRVVGARVVEGRQLVLMPKSPGTSALVAWLRDGRSWRAEVVVPAQPTRRIAQDLQRMLAGEPGLTVEAIGERVVVQGRHASAESQARIEAALRAFPQVTLLAAPAPRSPQHLVQEPMIHLDVRVVELRRSALDRLGIRWNADGMRGPSGAVSGYWRANSDFRGPSQGDYPVTRPDQRWVSYFGLATELTSVIDLLEQGGDGWTLAEPRLSCKSGGESRFVAGGEVPIPVTNGTGGTNVVYKSYGVIVEFRPVVDAAGNVSSSVVTEVSEPDPRNSNQGFVAFAKHRTETEFFLRQGETLVISGLLKQGGAKAASGLPGLARLPVLGRLFRSDEFRNDRTELVVMVTPRVAGADSEVNRAETRRAEALVADTRRRMAGRLAE